jgi:hypothetical protein
MVVKEGVLIVPYIYEGCIQVGQYLPYPPEIYIPDQEVFRNTIMMQFYESPVFKQCNVCSRFRRLDY